MIRTKKRGHPTDGQTRRFNVLYELELEGVTHRDVEVAAGQQVNGFAFGGNCHIGEIIHVPKVGNKGSR